MHSGEQAETTGHRLMRRWPVVLAGGLIGGAIAFAITWTSAPLWRARTEVLLAASPDQSSAAAILMSGNIATPLSLLHGVFDSQAVRQQLGKEFNLDSKTIEKMYFARQDPISNQIVVTVDSTNPELATKMSRRAVELAKIYEREASVTVASTRAKQIGEALESKQSEAELAAIRYSKFLANSKVTITSAGQYSSELAEVTRLESELSAKRIQRSGLAKRLNSSLSDAELPKSGELEKLRSQRAELESKLQQAKAVLGPEAPELVQLQEDLNSINRLYSRELSRAKQSVNEGLQRQIANLDSEINQLTVKLGNQRAITSNAPANSTQFTDEFRQLKAAQKNLLRTRMMFEEAKLAADVEKIQWSVLSPAFVEDKPVNKRLVRTPAAGAVLGIALASLISLSGPKRNRRKSNPELKEDSWQNAA